LISDTVLAFAAMTATRLLLGFSLSDPRFAGVAPSIWFFAIEVYFVQRFGGTPGKLLAKLRIVTMEGSPLTYKHAFRRAAPNYFIGLFGELARTAVILSTMSWGDYLTLTPSARLQLLHSLNSTPFFMVFSTAVTGWFLADFIAFFVGYDRRPLHDRLAGTMVVHRIPAIPLPPYKLERPVW
jgi:uncharacterized RDD family membrane protein YckC